MTLGVIRAMAGEWAEEREGGREEGDLFKAVGKAAVSLPRAGHIPTSGRGPQPRADTMPLPTHPGSNCSTSKPLLSLSGAPLSMVDPGRPTS